MQNKREWNKRKGAMLRQVFSNSVRDYKTRQWVEVLRSNNCVRFQIIKRFKIKLGIKRQCNQILIPRIYPNGLSSRMI